ncbi:glycosyltransferase family 2 protein, partial [bacterium]|nr:glycosyltransferase family 2 protein [bacterium]
MSTPFISVIIPTYNRKPKVILAVNSVLEQSYTNFELIVVDDASEDGTIESLEPIPDKRLITVSQKHAGVSAARNSGVSQSHGEFIAFLDSDDVWHEEKLFHQIEFHQKNPEYQISQTQEVWIRNGKRVNQKIKHQKPEGYIFPQSLHLCTVTPSSVLLTRKLFEENEGFDSDMKACEDYDLWLRITSKHKVGLINKMLLTKYGGHEDQLSQKYTAMDRFRIFSLSKIILSEKLNKDQLIQAMSVFEEKINILLLGTGKR